MQQDTFHPYCCSKEIIIEQMWISRLLQLKSDQILNTKSSSSINCITQLQHVETQLLSCIFFLLKLVLLHYRMILIRLLVYCRSRSGGSNLCSIFCKFKRKIWANGTNFEEQQIRQFFLIVKNLPEIIFNHPYFLILAIARRAQESILIQH